MKCLVTGAAGFIGSHLCDALLREGHKVIGVDDLSRGNLDNLKVALTYKNFKLKQVQLKNFKFEDHTFEKKFDWIFHLAAYADIVPSVEKPIEYYENNTNQSMRLMQYVLKHKPLKIVYAASSSCYGIPKNYPTSENEKLDPRYPYAMTKLWTELMIMELSQFYKVPAISLRLFNVYGPRARTNGAYGAVMGTFLAQLKADKPLTVVGDGTQTRDFIHVDDVVEAFILAAKSDKASKIYNIGSGRSNSINYLIKLLGGTKVEYLPVRHGEPEVTRADRYAAWRDIGWKPKRSFESGVKELLSSIDNYASAPVWTKETIEQATKEWFKYL